MLLNSSNIVTDIMFLRSETRERQGVFLNAHTGSLRIIIHCSQFTSVSVSLHHPIQVVLRSL